MNEKESDIIHTHILCTLEFIVTRVHNLSQSQIICAATVQKRILQSDLSDFFLWNITHRGAGQFSNPGT